jgi:hypothetical protein
MCPNLSLFIIKYDYGMLIYWSKHYLSTLHCYNGAWFGAWQEKIRCQLVKKFSQRRCWRYESPGTWLYVAGQVDCIISKDPSSFIFRGRRSKVAGLIDPEVSGTLTLWKIVNYFAQWPRVTSQKVWMFYNCYIFNLLISGPEAVMLLNSHTLCSCWFGCSVYWMVIGDIFCHLVTLCARMLLPTLM